MTPYYQDKWVTIYHGDCREILPQLDVKVDLVLTDPPYGIDYQSARRTDAFRKEKIQGDTEYPMWIFDYKPLSALFVWCRWDNLYQIPKPKSFIAWDKQRHSMGDLNHEYGRQWEACAFYPFENHEFIHRPKDLISWPCIPHPQLVHPNEKPVEVMRQVLVNNKGNLILDPFMGVAPVLLAAKSLNRYSIGIEIEEKYCEIAAKRCMQESFELFPAEQKPTTTQGSLL